MRDDRQRVKNWRERISFRKAVLLLDTSALVKIAEELADRRVGPVRRYLVRKRRVFISVVSVAEFIEGVDGETQGMRFLTDLGFTVVPIGHGLARQCAILQRRLAARGSRLGENDAWIAATALANKLELVGNDAAFARVPGLRYRRI